MSKKNEKLKDVVDKLKACVKKTESYINASEKDTSQYSITNDVKRMAKEMDKDELDILVYALKVLRKKQVIVEQNRSLF